VVVSGMREVSVSPVSSKGQVTIPKEIRDALELRAGDRIIFFLEGERIIIKKVNGEHLSEVLARSGPWGEDSLGFQRELREEWPV